MAPAFCGDGQHDDTRPVGVELLDEVVIRLNGGRVLEQVFEDAGEEDDELSAAESKESIGAPRPLVAGLRCWRTGLGLGMSRRAGLAVTGAHTGR